MGRRDLIAICSLLAASVVAPCVSTTPAWASSVTGGAVKCTITPRPPRLDLSRMIRGAAVVQCTSAALVGIEVSLVELDGFVEDRTSATPLQTMWVPVAANTPLVVVTNRTRCINTELGNEEYATKARINLSGVVSAWDRTVPDLDSFAC